MVDAERQRLQDQIIAVLIENQARQQVAFREHEPLRARSGRRRIEHGRQRERSAKAPRRFDAPTEKFFVEFFLLCSESSDGDLRPGVEQPATEETVFVVADVDLIAGGRFTGDPGDFTGVHPAVACLEPTLLAHF